MQTMRTDLLMDLLSAPASGLLFLREFAINGCEAIRDGANDDGTVLFDVDRRQLASSGIARLSVIDDGVGMSAEELLRYIGNLSSSGKDHRLGANHGVGCKISGARASPRGVEFRSWRNGAGWMVVLCQHESGIWGLRELRPGASGDERYLLPLGDEQRPALLAGPRQSDGTQVTFLGGRCDEHSYLAPRIVTEGRSMWIRRYLNDRLYEIPTGATILVRENVSVQASRDARAPSSSPGVSHEVVGARTLLRAHSQSSGTVKLSDACCHWWVLAKRRGRRRRAVAHEWAATGYFGALHRGEIFESQQGVHGGQQGLSGYFKIRLGSDRVVLLIEPDEAAAVKPDIARTTLSIDGQGVPWVRWGQQFAAAMPDAISELQRSLIDGAGDGRRRGAVTARWARVSEPIVALLNVPPRPTLRDPGESRLSPGAIGADRAPARTPTAPADGSPDSLNEDRLKAGCELKQPTTPVTTRIRERARPSNDAALRRPAVTLRYPTTLWLPIGEVPDELHNMAARYDASDDVLTISPDFPVYVAQLDRLLEEYGSDPEAGAIITEKLRQWWELTLVEAVDMARRLAATERELRLLTSPWSLSAAMSALSPIAQHLRREIPQQLGRSIPFDSEGPAGGAS